MCWVNEIELNPTLIHMAIMWCLNSSLHSLRTSIQSGNFEGTPFPDVCALSPTQGWNSEAGGQVHMCVYHRCVHTEEGSAIGNT